MTIRNEKFLVNTKGFTDMIDITRKVLDCVKRGAEKNAHVSVFVAGSTAGITSIEYEPGLVKDFPEILEQLAPVNRVYEHDKTWHDGNGYAHIRAAIVGNSFSFPFVSGDAQLGTWQQIVLIDFDNKPRARNIIVQIIS